MDLWGVPTFPPRCLIRRRRSLLGRHLRNVTNCTHVGEAWHGDFTIKIWGFSNPKSKNQSTKTRISPAKNQFEPEIICQ